MADKNPHTPKDSAGAAVYALQAACASTGTTPVTLAGCVAITGAANIVTLTTAPGDGTTLTDTVEVE